MHPVDDFCAPKNSAAKSDRACLSWVARWVEQMGSMSTSRPRPESFGQLNLADHAWARVDIGDLGGADSRAVLTGATKLDLPIAHADPMGDVGDLIGTYWAGLFLVSQEFARFLSWSDLTGWQTLAIRVDGNPAIHDVALLQVVGRCGPIEEAGAGRTLNLSSWDGSDLFVPANESSIVISTKAAEILRSAGLRNVEIGAAGFELMTP